MKASNILSILAGALPLLAAPTEPTRRQRHIIPGKFIVELKPGASPELVSAHHLHVRGLLGQGSDRIKERYHIGDFNAYLGEYDSAEAEIIASMPEVLSVQPDEYIYVQKTDFDTGPGSSKGAVTTQRNASWALGDISHKLNGSNEYVYDDRAGQGQTAYILDSGIRLTHTEFEGKRAVRGFHFVNDTNSDGDSHGSHGTFVAGCVVGKVGGVAKKAKVVDVKVMGASNGIVSPLYPGF
jgi:oryzin